MMFKEKGRLDIKQWSEEDQDTCHADLWQKESFAVVWLKWKHALSHVQETLRESDAEKRVGLFAVIAGEFSEYLSKAGVVCTSTDQTEADDSSKGDFGVSVIGKLGQHVHSVDFGVGNAQHGEGQGNHFLFVGLTEMQNVVEESCGHFVTDFLTGSNQSQPKNGSLAVFLITQAFMDHFLNLEHITASNVGSTDDHDFNEFLDGMLDHADSLKSGLAFVLLTHEK